VPESETDFNIPRANGRISFVWDASRKVTSFHGYQNRDFEGKILD
jgi:hypothetical protein